jgi:hypothetical protein
MRRLFGAIVIAISCATYTVPEVQLTTNSAGADATAHKALVVLRR